MFKFFLTFIFLQVVLFAAELTHPAQQYIVIPFTESIAQFSAWIIKIFDPRVVSEGIILQHLDNGFAVAIQAGCNGVEAAIVLFSAILAFPSPWKYKLWGIGIGFLAVELLNLLRIITLFYIGQWNQTVFEWAHLYIWEALIMLDVLIMFLVWLRYAPRPSNTLEKSNAI